jgi:esterase
VIKRMQNLTFNGKGGQRLAAVDYGGDGSPVLLVHGMGAHTGWWDWCAPLMTQTHRVVAMDFRGHGDSEWNSAGRYQVGDYADDIEAVRKGLGWERFYLVGHSLGARASLHYACRYPERLERLAALDFLAQVEVRSLRKFERRMKRRQPSYGTAQALEERFHLQPAGTSASTDILEDLARRSGKQLANGRWTWKFDWNAFYFEYTPIWDEIAGLAVPTLVLRGSESTVMSAAVYQRILQALPEGTGIEIPGAHHHLPLDAPQETAHCLLEYGCKKFASIY